MKIVAHGNGVAVLVFDALDEAHNLGRALMDMHGDQYLFAIAPPDFTDGDPRIRAALADVKGAEPVMGEGGRL